MILSTQKAIHVDSIVFRSCKMESRLVHGAMQIDTVKPVLKMRENSDGSVPNIHPVKSRTRSPRHTYERVFSYSYELIVTDDGST